MVCADGIRVCRHSGTARTTPHTNRYPLLGLPHQASLLQIIGGYETTKYVALHHDNEYDLNCSEWDTRAADFGQVGDEEGEGTVGRINDTCQQGSAQLNIL